MCVGVYVWGNGVIMLRSQPPILSCYVSKRKVQEKAGLNPNKEGEGGISRFRFEKTGYENLGSNNRVNVSKSRSCE